MHRIEMGITHKMGRADTVATIAEVDVDNNISRVLIYPLSLSEGMDVRTAHCT